MSIRIWSAIVCLAFISGLLGCRATEKCEQSRDAKVLRFSERGRTAYSEGYNDEAIESYRKAMYRAWAMDDPYESGTNAYNLAACFYYAGCNQVAKEWLVDARSDLDRGNHSAANVLLLMADIATDEGRFGDAEHLIAAAQCGSSPCEVCEDSCARECKATWLEQVPVIGKSVREKAAEQSCRDAFEGRVHLSKAKLAAEHYDVCTAKSELALAVPLIESVCDDALRADLCHTSGLIGVAEGALLDAAQQFDQEAYHLRMAGEYRGLPIALKLAAAAYQEIGYELQAADRLCRVARIWLARGEPNEAWCALKEASMLAGCQENEVLKIRLCHTAQELDRMLSNKLPPEAPTDEQSKEKATPDLTEIPQVVEPLVLP